MARVTWRAAGYAANLARGRNYWPNDCKTKTPVPGGGVEVAREAQETQGVIGGAVEKVGAITAGAVEKVGAVTDGAVEKVGAITGGVVEKVGAVPDKTRRRERSC